MSNTKNIELHRGTNTNILRISFENDLKLESMVHIGEVETFSRLQRLLWTKEYISLEDSTVTVESFFVLEDSLGNALKMVRGGLCSNIFVLADCLSRCKTSREACFTRINLDSRFEFLDCQNEGLDDMELMWLLPLNNIHLTVSKKASRHGLRVLRLRFCSGQLYHLELAESKRNSKIWMAWVQSVEKLRRHPRYLFQDDGSNSSGKDVGRGLDRRDNCPSRTFVGDRKQTTSLSKARGGKMSVADVRKLSQPEFKKSTINMKNGLGGEQTLAMHLVEHFNDHMRHTAGAHVGGVHDGDPFRHTQPSSVCLRNEGSSGEGEASTSSAASCPTTESEGSILSEMSIDRFLQHLNMESLFRVCLCVGDYFGQFVFEAGTSGLPKRMASLSAMRHLIEVEDCNMDSDDVHFGFGIERCSLRHCSSLPSALDGEASFIEDLKQVDKLTHRTSLAYLDLTNENDERQAHVINGHVMLITAEEYELYKEVMRHRNSPIDLRFATARHPDVVRKKKKLQNVLRGRRNAVTKITDEVQSKIKHFTQKFHHLPGHSGDVRAEGKDGADSLTSKTGKPSKMAKKIKSIFRKSKQRKEPAQAVRSEHSHIYEYIDEIEIDDVANELTVIDAELFLRIHESELVDCVWLKEERHSKAPNVMACIDFFHRLLGIVVTEVLLPLLPRERAEIVARFTRIAEKCLIQKNFNSTKAIVSALRSPAILRLQSTWGCFQRMYPESFKLWQNIYHVMSDDMPNLAYLTNLQQAVSSPPCLPFLGTFLKQVTEFYVRGESDKELVQVRPKGGQSSCSTSQTSRQSSVTEISTLKSSTESLLRSRMEKPLRKEDGTRSSRSLFVKLLYSSLSMNQRVRSFFESDSSTSSGRRKSDSTVSSGETTDSSVYLTESSNLHMEKPPSCIKPARRRHIQRLIIDYAKQLAEECGMTWTGRRAIPQSNTWDYVFDQALEWSNLFKKMGSVDDKQVDTPLHNFSNLKLIADETGPNGPSLEAIWSEYDLTSTLFHFQLGAVRFKLESKENVRDFLLRAHYNSDVDNFALSLRREPPNQ